MAPEALSAAGGVAGFAAATAALAWVPGVATAGVLGLGVIVVLWVGWRAEPEGVLVDCSTTVGSRL